MYLERPGRRVRKCDRAAALIRGRIADGSLAPGMPVAFATELAEETGFHVQTCRAALRILVGEGVLTRVSAAARPHVAGTLSGERQELAVELSRSLAGFRRLAGLKQRELAGKLGVSLTTVGHAETGRLWQGRRFWDAADLVLDARGSLLGRYDAWKAHPAVEAQPAVPEAAGAVPETAAAAGESCEPDGIVITLPCDPVPVTVRWGNGAVTTIRPPPGFGSFRRNPASHEGAQPGTGVDQPALTQ